MFKHIHSQTRLEIFNFLSFSWVTVTFYFIKLFWYFDKVLGRRIPKYLPANVFTHKKFLNISNRFSKTFQKYLKGISFIIFRHF